MFRVLELAQIFVLPEANVRDDLKCMDRCHGNSNERMFGGSAGV